MTLHAEEPTLVAEFVHPMNFNSYLRKMKWMTQGYYHSLKIIINNSWESNFIRSVVCSSQISSHQCTELGGNWPVTSVLLGLKICWLLVDRENDITVISYLSHNHTLHAKRWFYIRSGLGPWMKMKRSFIYRVNSFCF